MKICEICGAEFEPKAGGSSRKYCFECSPSYPKGGSRATTIKALRKAMKKEAVKRFGGKCIKCGYDKCIAALEFHHRNPEDKKFALSADKNTHSWEEYLAEAQKCDLLCSNCHAEIHFNE
jgi:5-methylcytosine-specific restriction endonuclease McrA